MKKETKQCKYCQEEINADAKICPHCRKKQKGDSEFKILPVIILFSIIAILAIIYVLTMRSAEESRKKSMFEALSNNGGKSISEITEEYEEKINDAVGNNEESANSGIIELWEDSNIFVGYNDSIYVIFKFPEENSARQLYDYLTAYSILDKKYDDFSIYIIVNKDETPYLMRKENGEIKQQIFPESWNEILKKIKDDSKGVTESLKEELKSLGLSNIKSDLEIITNVIENAEEKAKNIKSDSENIETLKIWENGSIKMNFQDESPVIFFEFTNNEVPRQVYNFFLIYNVLKDSYKTFVISAIIHNEEDIQMGLATIAFLNGESITRILPDSWEKFIDENKNDNDQIAFENSLSETTREEDANKLKEAIENAVQ